MVRALLDGSKTQTRRAWREQPPAGVRVGYVHGETKSPYGQAGDQLWVREAWAAESEFDAIAPKDLRVGQRIYYPADKHMRADTKWYTQEPRPIEKRPDCWRVRPSIHMPRWVSRISLEVTGVRVERLQDISRGDAMAEGCPFPNMAQGDDPRQWYSHLWEQINGPGSWDANPWVWVVEFKRVTP